MRSPEGQFLARFLPRCRSLGPSLLHLARRPAFAHLLVVSVLYALFSGAAWLEEAAFIRGGIGFIQNPPFFAHLVAGSLSIPLVLLICRRVARLGVEPDGRAVLRRARRELRTSRLKRTALCTTSLAGLFCLANNLVLSFGYEVKIYDSPSFPATFIIYSLIRAYYYLWAYPLLFSVVPVLTLTVFKALRRSAVRYEPFHWDGMGGLKRYFSAVDSPIYALQSVTVLIALMNYWGWGGMYPVPSALAVGAPIVIALLALALFLAFRLATKAKRLSEIQSLRQHQSSLFVLVRDSSDLKGSDYSALVEKIEVLDRIIDRIQLGSSERKSMVKYGLNVVVALSPYVLKPLGDRIANWLWGGLGG